MTKYKIYVDKMLSENKQVFDEFKLIHDAYTLNPDNNQDKFNLEGEKVLEVIRDYENRLCANTERGVYNKYSTNLSEKFQQEVKKHFPMIDCIGLIVEKGNSPNNVQFAIKKIKLG